MQFIIEKDLSIYYLKHLTNIYQASLVDQTVKNPSAMQET